MAHGMKLTYLGESTSLVTMTRVCKVTALDFKEVHFRGSRDECQLRTVGSHLEIRDFFD